MKGINVITADQLKHWDTEVDTPHGWKLARPHGRSGLRRRIALAWKVFTGRADVLVWSNHQ